MKDWNGNQNSIYKTLGASNHTEKERQPDDYYATEPKAAELLLEQEEFHHTIWECACGEGHLAKVFEAHGHEVISTDLVYRGYGDPDVITNPPYKFALEFVQRALDSIKPGRKVAMFLKLQFLEGKSRKNFFQITPPRRVYVSSSRLKCAKNGEFESIASSAVAYAWFVWEKGYRGETVVKWIN